MHESYDDDYYEENYDDGQDYDQSQSDWNKFYFKFDVTYSPLSDWINTTIDKLLGDQFVAFPVNDCLSNAGEGTSLLYLGNNQYNETVWKNKYFIQDKTQDEYIKHLQGHIKHFVAQPSYYKGLFDILN